MTEERDGAIMALDAALNSIASLQGFAEALKVDEAVVQAIYGIMGTVGAARILIARGAEEPEEPEDGSCAHKDVQERRVGAGVVKFCAACGEFLE